MPDLSDNPDRYGVISRTLHWGMAALFAAQFLSAGARLTLPRGDTFRELLWSYHHTLGVTLFLLVLLRGAWGLANMRRRPPAHTGLIGQAATAGHVAIYALMVIVPVAALAAEAGDIRGFSYLGIEIFPPRETRVASLQALEEWHATLGWIVGLLVLGHIAMAVGWHHLIKRDGSLERMSG
ncbi:cytochrome b [Primorskyibacter marinus]|uniref:cytochrome b n=1 Tax=Primorskyibacter marinus TaxID=1977320 RepID=UPI000E308E2F|nr:cytochrome b [Primorskyibacter marinus]